MSEYKYKNEIIQRVNRARALTHNWDTYEGLPTEAKCADKLRDILLQLQPAWLPHVSPLNDGGMQAEFSYKRCVLEIVVESVGEPYFYYANISGCGDECASVENNLEDITMLLYEMRLKHEVINSYPTRTTYV